MGSDLNKRRLFIACSLALVVTAMTFSIRANLLGTLAHEFGLSLKEIGEIASAAFWGFTVAMFIGGPLCDKLGIGRMYFIAFVSHMAGILLTIVSTGYWPLFLSTLLVGLGNGFVESASYAMVSSMYSDNKSKKINDWHIWFPGGIVIGGLISYGLNFVDPGNWKLQMIVMIPPTLIYGYLFFKQKFPKSERITMGISDAQMVKECFRPIFIFMILCMFLTAATELGTNQWIAELLSQIGVPAILLLVFINGIMALGRANAGFILKRFSSAGLLLVSSILSFIGLFWLGYAVGYTAFIAAGIFALGVCFFWPTMIGFVAENLPRTGPLGLSLMGGVGLLSTALVLPFMGAIYQNQIDAASKSLSATSTDIRQISGEVQLIAGAHTLRYVSIMPAILIVAFAILYVLQKRKKSRESLLTVRNSDTATADFT
jgi:MFS family permease